MNRRLFFASALTFTAPVTTAAAPRLHVMRTAPTPRAAMSRTRVMVKTIAKNMSRESRMEYVSDLSRRSLEFAQAADDVAQML